MNNDKKNTIAIVALFVILSMLFAIAVMAMTGVKEDAEWEGPAQIEWVEVNVRSSYSMSSDVISTLSEGDEVICTGRRYYFFTLDDDPSRELSDHWTEVQLADGSIGWVYGAAL